MKEKRDKKKSKRSAKVSKQMRDQIPFLKCFEEGGMIETEKGVYSVTYEIRIPENYSERELYNPSIVHRCMEDIFGTLKEYMFQFTIRNSYITEEEYLAKVLLSDDGREIIRDYNHVISENMDIGHNNFDRSLYLTVSCPENIPEDALIRFEELDERLSTDFHELYGYRCIRMTLTERLELLHDIYHPANEAVFGEKVNFDGSGFSIANMRRMKMTTKDVIMPSVYDTKKRDVMNVGGMYARMFFINSIPDMASHSVINDLANISSNSILSILYQPIDAKVGFDGAARSVKKNTEVSLIPVRDTVEDRRNRRMERRESLIAENEQAYFHKAALIPLRDAVAKDQPLIMTTFVICLFASSLDDLKRDTGLLRLSASKYACQIRTFDLQQHEAFVSALPLCNLKVNAGRMFDIDRLCDMLPLNTHAFMEYNPTLLGLNAINDNLIFTDRRNRAVEIIAGMEHSGKTHLAKREAVDTIMTTEDLVYVVTFRPEEWSSLVKRCDGEMSDFAEHDFFINDCSYALLEDKADMQKLFLEAFMAVMLRFYRKRYTDEEKKGMFQNAAMEADKLKGFTSFADASAYAKEHGEEFPLFLSSINDYVPINEPLTIEWLNVIAVQDPVEMLLSLDRLWNMAIVERKCNSGIHIIIDGIDELIYSSAGCDYLLSLFDKMGKMFVPLTLVVNDSVSIVADQDASIEFDYLLSKVNLYKLLTQGPVERKKYVEQLNIPDTLVPYITDRKTGEGILISPSANIPFNDHFAGEDDPFYSVFR